MPGPALPSGTVTLVFTDIEGSTRLLQRLGSAYAGALQAHRRLLRGAFQGQGGVEVDTQGDTCFYAFVRATDALAAAAAAQAALVGQLRVRIGVHTGEPQVTEEGYVGFVVHQAARICAAAHGGQVVLSEATAHLVDASLHDLGLHRLKDVPVPQHLYQLGHGDFPPLRSLNYTNLPDELTRLIGRETAVSHVASLVEHHRLVTLTGPGGVGKTRLGVRVSRMVLDRFPDGCWFIDLAAIDDPELVPAVLCGVLRSPEAAGQSQLDAAVNALRDKRCLLLFDNCEHLDRAPANTARELLARCHALRLLATSRRPLNIEGECLAIVEPLDVGRAGDGDVKTLSSAAELFLERAGLHGVRLDANPLTRNAIAQLCRRLDGIPLAIELAAARTRSLAPHELLKWLDERFRLLARPLHYAVAARQQTLEATIAWSYSLLRDGDQAAMRRLSVFRGGFTMDAAAAVCADVGGDLDTVDTVANLVDSSLVQVQDRAAGRYRYLESIGLYAEQRLRERGEEPSARDRHAGYFAAVACEAAQHLDGSDEVEWFSKLEADEENLRSALRWCLEDTGERSLGVEMVRHLGEPWRHAGRFGQAQKYLKLALQAPHDPAPATEADLERILALVLAHLEQPEIAIGHAHRAVDLARLAGDSDLLARSLVAVANSVVGVDGVEAAHAVAEEAFNVAMRVDDPRLLVYVLGATALIQIREGDLVAGLATIRSRMELARRLGNTRLQAASAMAEAKVLGLSGDLRTAYRVATESVRLAEISASAGLVIDAMYVQSVLAVANDDFETALRLVSEGARISAQREWPALMAACFWLGAFSVLRLGNAERASTLWHCGQRWRPGGFLDDEATLIVPDLPQLPERLRFLLGPEAFERSEDYVSSLTEEEMLLLLREPHQG